MKAAVFSDTHGCVALMLEAVRRSRPDVIIHLGDYARDTAEITAEFPEIPLYSVSGNCDIGSAAPMRDTVPLGAVKAFICHGHEYNVRCGIDRLVYAAMEEGCRIAMFGHTHEAIYETLGGVTVINPGTAGKGRTLTWACLTVFDSGAVDCRILDL